MEGDEWTRLTSNRTTINPTSRSWARAKIPAPRNSILVLASTQEASRKEGEGRDLWARVFIGVFARCGTEVKWIGVWEKGREGVIAWMEWREGKGLVMKNGWEMSGGIKFHGATLCIVHKIRTMTSLSLSPFWHRNESETRWAIPLFTLHVSSIPSRKHQWLF